MMLSGTSGPCCAECAGTSTPVPRKLGYVRLALLALGAMGVAGAVWLWTRRPPPLYQDPTNDRKRTVEVPVETAEEVVWGGRW